MERITLHNREIYYREWGNAGEATFVILHGWGVDSSQYETLGPLLAKGGYHVVVPDLPGWGSTPAPPQAWSVSDYAQWVQEFVSTVYHPERAQRVEGSRTNPVRDRGRSSRPISNGTNVRGADKLRDSSPTAQNDRIVLFGHSFGGRVAIKYAAKHPEQVRALILCAAAGIKMPDTIKKRALKVLAKIGKQILRVPPLSKFDTIARKALYRIAGSYDYMHGKGVMVDVLVKAVEEDLTPLLPRIKIPTLLLWGTADRATPYKDGQTMARFIPGAKLVTFEGERHNLPKHIPNRLAHEIKQYLDTI